MLVLRTSMPSLDKYVNESRDTLPIFIDVSLEEVDRICNVIKEIKL